MVVVVERWHYDCGGVVAGRRPRQDVFCAPEPMSKSASGLGVELIRVTDCLVSILAGGGVVRVRWRSEQGSPGNVGSQDGICPRNFQLCQALNMLGGGVVRFDPGENQAIVNRTRSHVFVIYTHVIRAGSECFSVSWSEALVCPRNCCLTIARLCRVSIGDG